MEQMIKEITEKLKNGIITKDEADKILLNLFDVIKREVEDKTRAKWIRGFQVPRIL